MNPKLRNAIIVASICMGFWGALTFKAFVIDSLKYEKLAVISILMWAFTLIFGFVFILGYSIALQGGN